MLHIITPDIKTLSRIEFQNILEHRLSFAKEEGVEIANEEGRDEFDTDQTTYLIYQDQSYGIIGSARIAPLEKIPSKFQKFLPNNEKIPFVLVDCISHIPSESIELTRQLFSEGLEKYLESFYTALGFYLENQAIFNQTAFIYFILRKEDVDFLQLYTQHKITILKEFKDPSKQESQLLGFLDFSEVLLHLDKEKKA